MTKLSIDRAWTETRALLSREGRLLLPVALAFFALPAALLTALTPAAPPGQLPPAGLWTLLIGPVLVLGVIGSLALSLLALRPGLSVGEGLTEAARRAPALLGAAFLLLLLFFIALLPLAVVAALVFPAPNAANVGAFSLVIVIPIMILSVRFMLLNPAGAVERLGPVKLLRRSWALTRGHTWRLFGFVLLVSLAYGLLLFAVSAVISILLTLAGASTDPNSAGGALLLLVSAFLNSLLLMLVAVAAARIYAQLAGDGISGI